MPTPKKIQDLLNKKQSFIDAQRNGLEKSVLDMQKQLLDKIVSDAIVQLDTKDGKILNTQHNYKILSTLDNVYEQFNALNQVPVVTKMAEGLLAINELNSKYFLETTLDDVTSKRFDSVIAKTDKLMAARIGITEGGEIKTGGFLDSFISDNRLITETKQLVARGITGGMNITDLKNELSDKVIGTEEKIGGFERYYKQFAYDTFQEYDRAYAKNVADEFDMNYAVYSGGLIKDSRDFCRDHNNHVYSRDEIAEFGNWTYESAQNISEFNDSSNPSGTPSYIEQFPGYDPFTHLGGFNCRHVLRWINKFEAIRLRPELENET